MSRLLQRDLTTTLGERIANDRPALTNELKFTEDNSDAIVFFMFSDCDHVVRVSATEIFLLRLTEITRIDP